MESVQCKSSIPFRSKKPTLQATPKKPATLLPEERPAMLEMPEKCNRPPRVRNQNMALSIKDVKRTAQMLQKGDLNRSDPVGSIRSRSGLQMRDIEKGKRIPVENVESSVRLPEKYLMLCQFFNFIVSVIPLLRMRRKPSTFTNICPKIQSLTDRRFTVNHLAQLKYILPEAILVKKTHLRDEQTDCMKEELLVTLDMEAVKVSKNMNDIKELFRARIENYYEAHLEENGIPEAELPSLFYQSNHSETSSTDKSSCVATASHVPQLFKRSFSSETALRKSLISEPSRVLATQNQEISAEFSGNSLVINDDSKGSIDIQGTPVKEALTSIRLVANTPVIKPSGCYKSPDDVVCDVPTKLVRRPIPTRSLKFDFEDNTETEVQDNDALGSNVESDKIDFLPKNLLQSVREKERKILEEQDPAISQARRRHQLMSDVPKLFDMIHLLFQSTNGSVMTRKQLLYKIITGHSEIIDRGEIEEQFELLQDLAPDYISERLCTSGDTLVCVNKSASAQSVRAKLLQPYKGIHPFTSARQNSQI